MENIKTTATLEEEIIITKVQLMLKGMELDLLRQNRTKENRDEIYKALSVEKNQLTQKWYQLTEEIKARKFSYQVMYEVFLKENSTNSKTKETYTEILWLDKDMQIDFPFQNGWQFHDEKISNLLNDILFQLSYRYNEVSLLQVKRLQN